MNPSIRELFPVTRNHVYLNTAAAGPRSRRVLAAMTAHLEEVTEHGSIRFPEWCRHFEQVRRLAARFVGARPHQMAFVRNTSAGLSAVANGLQWRAGDNVVASRAEFSGNIYPWMRLKEAHGVELRLAEERDGRVDAEELLALVDGRTRLLAQSWVQFASGFRCDLQRLGRFCRERDLLFVVDAIQGLGAFPLDVERDCVDAFAADGHKYLCAPEGLGLLYLSDRALERVRPTEVGWMSVEHGGDHLNYRLRYQEGGPAFECGTLNAAGMYGLGAALELFLEIGREAIAAHLLQQSAHLGSGLESRGYPVVSSQRPGEVSGIVTCTHPRHAAETLQQRLRECNIITAARAGRLRISHHLFNNRQDLDALLEALPE